MPEQLSKDIEALNERRARRFWCGLVAGFLALQLVTNVIAVIAATSQKQDLVVPDYYQKGLDWDKRTDSHAQENPPEARDSHQDVET